MMSPLADNEHQEIAAGLVAAIRSALGWNTPFGIFPGVNVSDREDQWEHNYRCPDVVVFAPNTKAKNCGTHWYGGPDFAVEITSPNDRSREKFEFYGKVGVVELLLIDRSTWTLELYRHSGDQLKLENTTNLHDRRKLESRMLGISLQLVPGTRRPAIEITANSTGQIWPV